MLEGVLKVGRSQRLSTYGRVSILGMLEGVLKVLIVSIVLATNLSFNPWYVGGGVKSFLLCGSRRPSLSFNPWYVGGGVKRLPLQARRAYGNTVSILGMLEGVLKELALLHGEFRQGLFQSLVCWRGC